MVVAPSDEQRLLKVPDDVPERLSSGSGAFPVFTTCLYLLLTGCYIFVLYGAVDTANQIDLIGDKAGGVATLTKAFSSGLSKEIVKLSGPKHDSMEELQQAARQAVAGVGAFEGEVKEAARRREAERNEGVRGSEEELRKNFQASAEKLKTTVEPVRTVLKRAERSLKTSVAMVNAEYLRQTHLVASSIDGFLVGIWPMANLIATHGGPNVTAGLKLATDAAPSLDTILDSVYDIMPNVLTSLEAIQKRLDEILGSVGSSSALPSHMLGVPLNDLEVGLQQELEMAAAALRDVLESPVLAIDTAVQSIHVSARLALDALSKLEQAADAVASGGSEDLSDAAHNLRFGAMVLFGVVTVMTSLSYGYACFLEKTWEDNEIARFNGLKPGARGICMSCFSSCGIGCCFWVNVLLLDLLSLVVLAFALLVCAANFGLYSMEGGCAGNGLLSDDRVCTSTLASLQVTLATDLVSASTCARSDILICEGISTWLAPYTLLAAALGVLLAFNLPRRMIWVRGTVMADVAFTKVLSHFDAEKEALVVGHKRDSSMSKVLGTFLGCNRCVSTKGQN